MSDTTIGLLAAACGIASLPLLCIAARTAVMPGRRPALPVRRPEPALWLQCNTTACAHLTRRHTRNADGTATCTECQHNQKGTP